MAKSGELKNLIVERIKQEWADPDKGEDWKDESWQEEDGLAELVFKKLSNPRKWKRVYKGKVTVGDEEFVMREFLFEDEEVGIISARVTCDEADNFLDIEFELQ